MHGSPPPQRTDSLIDTSGLEAMLQEGTGRGVKVALLDTGVDAGHPGLEACVVANYDVVGRGRSLECQPGESVDTVGHGTACAGIIHSGAPEAEIYSLRVLDKSSVGTGDHLIHGLKWAIEQKMDIVNLSLGTTYHRMASILSRLADRASYSGTILVAAAGSRSMSSFPASFSSLIAVDSGTFADPLSFHFRLGESAEITANGIDVRAPSPDGEYQLWTGSSFACPHVTAILARLRSRMPALTPFEAKAFLWYLRANRESGEGES